MSSLGNVLPFDKKKKSASRDEQAATATTLHRVSDAAPRWHSLTRHWPYVGHKLTNLWTFIDPTLPTIRWPHAEHLLTMSDQTLTTRWPLHDHYWPLADHTLTTQWPFTGYSMTTYWPLVDHRLTIHWLCSGRSAESTEDSFDFSGNDTALVNETTCCSNLAGWSVYSQWVVSECSLRDDVLQ